MKPCVARPVGRTKHESQNPDIPSLDLSLWNFKDVELVAQASSALVKHVESFGKFNAGLTIKPKTRLSKIGALKEMVRDMRESRAGPRQGSPQ